MYTKNVLLCYSSICQHCIKKFLKCKLVIYYLKDWMLGYNLKMTSVFFVEKVWNQAAIEQKIM